MRNHDRSFLCLVIGCLAFFFGPSRAQAQSPLPRWELGFHASQFIYQGDLAPSASGSYKTAAFGAGVYVNRLLSPALALRTTLEIGSLRGDDAAYFTPAWRQQRNLRFHTPLFEASEMLVWNILANNYKADKPGLTPYLFAGIGYSFLDIHRDWSHFNDHAFDSTVIRGLQADQRHSLPRAIPVIPLGGGVRYAITPSVSLTAEATYHLSFTDYLDGFSQSGNPNRKDKYYTYSIGFVYRFTGVPLFGKGPGAGTIRCPTIHL